MYFWKKRNLFGKNTNTFLKVFGLKRFYNTKEEKYIQKLGNFYFLNYRKRNNLGRRNIF